MVVIQSNGRLITMVAKSTTATTTLYDCTVLSDYVCIGLKKKQTLTCQSFMFSIALTKQTGLQACMW